MDDKIYTALGLMSGTSLDGVDVAVIETDGVDIFGFGPSCGTSYVAKTHEELVDTVRQAVEWGANGPVPISIISKSALVDTLHKNALSEFKWMHGRDEFDVIGYHGQTVFHLPPSNTVNGSTLQLGDGQSLADYWGVPTVFDFRTADVEAGGQGAPLAPIYHEALVRYSKLDGKVAVLNIGGVSNVTAIDGGEIVWATDCGPGNGPLDSWVAAHSEEKYDKDGRLSYLGKVDHKKINQWLKRDFFKRSVPRSADRYDFDVLGEMDGMSLEDGAATLASFCAQAVARDLAMFNADQVIVCGGGRKNSAIMAMLDMHTDAKVVSAETVGWDGDMLEAQAFAYLAVRTLKGLPISFPETTGCPSPMTGGRVVYPK
jgi:anhydro-N-acetylmuramic acid kinase